MSDISGFSGGQRGFNHALEATAVAAAPALLGPVQRGIGTLPTIGLAVCATASTIIKDNGAWSEKRGSKWMSAQSPRARVHASARTVGNPP